MLLNLLFNPNDVLISDVLAFNPIAVLSDAILLVNVAESAFKAIAVFSVAILLVNVDESPLILLMY